VEGETVLDGVYPFFDGDAGTAEALGVGCDALPEPVRLFDDRADLLSGQLGWFRIF
jgi:hypothetical protein